MTRTSLRFAYLLTGILFIVQVASAQVGTGYPPFGSFSSGPFDTVNNGNLNVHFEIPIFSRAGRGLPFNGVLTYDSSIWQDVGSWNPVGQWGWRNGSETITGAVGYSQTQTKCTYPTTNYYYTDSNFVFYSPDGGVHTFPGFRLTDTSQCTGGSHGSGSITARDGSALYLSATTQGVGISATITLPSGVVITPPGGAYPYPIKGSGSVKDPNGNKITVTLSNVTDTLGTTALTYTSTNPDVYTYTGWSTNESVTVNYSSYNVKSNFGCNASEYGPNPASLVSSIVLPDGHSYSFTYEPTPGYPADTTGRIQSVTLPTGGTITYTYGSFNCNGGGVPFVSSLTRQTPDGTWNYSRSVVSGTTYSTTTITAPQDPQGNEPTTVVNTVSTSQGIYETERKVYTTTGGTLLETIDTCYNGSACPSVQPSNVTTPFTQLQVLKTLPTGQQSQTVTKYNSNSLPTEVDEYDYGLTLIRKTITAYDTNLGVIADRPLTVTIEDGSSNLVAQTTYGYDSNGNVLSESHSGPNMTTISRSFTYLGNGAIQTATDFKTNTTTYNYTSGSCNDAFPTSVSLPASLTESMTWNCNGGLMTSEKDPNGQITGLETTFQYNDPFWRLTSTTYPDTGSKTIDYTATVLDVYTALTSSITRHDETVLDGLGRVITQKLLDSGGSVISEVDTTYDALGRVWKVSNPHSSTSGPTDGTTQYNYDALNRPTAVIMPDNSTTSSSYSGNCVTVTDPGGKGRKLCMGALGWTTQAFEDPNNLNYQTTYSYNPLGNLTGVSQGSQTRSYSYDGLGRLTQATTPESGTTNYSYYTSGGPCSGDANAPCSRTDARSITTTYAYLDPLNRLTGKTYSDSTPPASFFYDRAPSSWPAWSGVTFSNALGRLTVACTGSNSGTCSSPQTAAVYSYDPMGRPTNFWQCTPYNCSSASIWQTAYNYDLAGDVTSWTHPANITFTNTVSEAQRITSIESSLVDSLDPQYLAQNITYAPTGQVSTLLNGCTGSGCTQIQETYVYNNRLQMAVAELGTASNHAQFNCWVYNYYVGVQNASACSESPANWPSGTNDNGNAAGYYYLDNVYSGLSHSASYSYDSLNRLTLGQATGNSTYYLNFSYDRYGNMGCSTNGQTNGPCPNWTFSASSNRISGFTYDAAGNVLADGSHNYQWDAEGRMSTLDGNAMTYNALGWRVYWQFPSSLVNWWHDADGLMVGANWGGTSYCAFLFMGSRLVADYETIGAYLDHPNALGSVSQATNWAGSTGSEALFYPWGQKWQDPSEIFAHELHQIFASLPDEDPSIEQYQTQFRRYSPTYGRWMSPDPLAGDVTNPQSLNRYAYVLNNPTTLTDPLGLDPPIPYRYWGQGGGNWNTNMTQGVTCYVDEVEDPGCSFLANATHGWTNAIFESQVAQWAANSTVTTAYYTPATDVWVSGMLPGGSIADVMFGFDGFWTVSTQTGDTGGLGLTGDTGDSGSFISLPLPAGFPPLPPLGPSTPRLPQIKQAAKSFYCGSSPANNVWNWFVFGASKGAAAGIYAGVVSGTVLGMGVGDELTIPVAGLLGGLTGGTIGAAGGAIWGSAASGVCSASGVY